MAEPPTSDREETSTERPSYLFDAPAYYVIRVVGELEASWSERLHGLRIVAAPDDPAAGGPVTELRGELRDQAALMGVLDALYNLQLTLLAVARGSGAADTA